ncbi:MAG: hypothetical protein VB115_09525 [Christensenellaceae bacterium]|nr:hypothetical protein [Christensenellaceae bacterium]
MNLYKNHPGYETLCNHFDAIGTALGLLEENTASQPSFTVIDGELYQIPSFSVSSVCCSLESISFCVSCGHMSDAYTLTRKVRDDLLQHIFVLRAIKKADETRTTKIEFATGQNMDEELFCRIVDDALREMITCDKTDAECAVDAWIKNDLKNPANSKMRRNYFGASRYVDYLRKDDLVGECFSKFFYGEIQKLQRMFDNYVHANGASFILSNLPQAMYDRFAQHCEAISRSLIIIASIYISCMTLISPSILMATDFIDALDMGLQPTDGSQYWIMPGIQEFMDQYFPSISPELKKYLRANNSYGMKIE